jgi:hypothetical protein
MKTTVGAVHVSYDAMEEYTVTFIQVQEFGKFYEDDIDLNTIWQRSRLTFVTTFLK